MENGINNLKSFDDTNSEIDFFINKGYSNFRRVQERSTNDVFLAQKDGQECFIKKYRVRDNDEERTKRKAQIEIDCYENLPKEDLIGVIEASKEEKYLVLEKVEFDEIHHTPELVKEAVDMYVNELAKVDVSFLPKFEWQKYNKFFEKIKTLENLGFLTGAEELINKFNINKDLIENSPKVFSHHDYNLFNVRKVNNKPIVFDFELACRDNAMYDMATLYIELQDNNELRQVFQENLAKSELYNQELFDLMRIRRSVDIMFGLKNKPDGVYFKKIRKP